MPPRKSWATVLDKKPVQGIRASGGLPKQGEGMGVAAAGGGKGVVRPRAPLKAVLHDVGAPPSKVGPPKNPPKKDNGKKPKDAAPEVAPSTFEKLSVGVEKIPEPYTGPARVLRIPSKISPVHMFGTRPVIVGDAKKTLDEIRSNLLQRYSRLHDLSSNSLEDRLVYLTGQFPDRGPRAASDVAARLQDLRSSVQPSPSVAPLKSPLDQMLLDTRQRAQASNLYHSLERLIQLHDERIKEMQSKLRLLSGGKH